MPGAAYFRKNESFMADHYIRGELLWNSVMMPVGSQEKEVPISVLGVLTIDGSAQKRREFCNLCQTQTILDILWMYINEIGR